MLPSHPVHRLPLLPATCTSTTVRVAAWLLGSSDGDAAAAAAKAGAPASCSSCQTGPASGGASDCGAYDLDGSASGDEGEEAKANINNNGPGSSSSCSGAAARDLRGVADEALSPTPPPAQNAAEGSAAAESCETRRRSLDKFMTAPVQVGVQARRGDDNLGCSRRRLWSHRTTLCPTAAARRRSQQLRCLALLNE